MSNNKKINFMTCSVATFYQYSSDFTKLEQREHEDREQCPCCGKPRYSYDDAMHTINTIKTGKGNRSRNRIFLRTYKCSGWWHLTSSKTGKNQRKLEYCA